MKSHKMLEISILDLSLKSTNLRLQLHLPGGNELIVLFFFHCRGTRNGEHTTQDVPSPL